MQIWWIGIYTPVIFLFYFYGVRRIFIFEQKQPTPDVVEPDADAITLKQALVNFSAYSLVIIGAGIWLPVVGNEIAIATGWGQNFVGSLFLAFSTSLPEITVSFHAMRIGARDMAVANLLGSNLFNLTVIGLDDLLFLKGPVLAAVSPGTAGYRRYRRFADGIPADRNVFSPHPPRTFQLVERYYSDYFYRRYLSNLYVILIFQHRAVCRVPVRFRTVLLTPSLCPSIISLDRWVTCPLFSANGQYLAS